jgi:hypothetical protein
LPGVDQFVFIGESVHALNDPNLKADPHDGVDIALTLEILELHKHKHVHTRAVHHIEVAIQFDNQTHERQFSPATTIATVMTWAKNRFQIDSGSRTDLALTLKPNNERPGAEVHLGELLKSGSHLLEFDLKLAPQSLVKITLDGKLHEVFKGDYLVGAFKSKLNVPADYELDEVINGEFKALNDEAKVDIKGGEVFVSHVRQGASS